MVAEHLADARRSAADELAQVIAQHLLDAADAAGSDDAEVAGLRGRAGDLLVRAGERAFALGAYDDAVRTWTSAAGLSRQPARPGARCWVVRRAALLRTNRYPEAHEAAERALRCLRRRGPGGRGRRGRHCPRLGAERAWSA